MSGVKRIVVFGPESTGKTTLARELAAAWGEPWSEEFVREFWDLKAGRIVGEDLGTIALGQMANEDRVMAAARRVAILDTDLLTCVLWDDLLFPEKCPAWVRTEAEARAGATTLFLLCDTDMPWEPDPQRCFPDATGREMCRKLWRETLETRGLPFVEIRGGGAARTAAAMAAVARFMRG